MYITPEAQNQGMGQALLNKLLYQSKAIAGLEQIQLTVAAHNTMAKKLYQKAGFRLYGMEKKAMKLEDQYIDEEWMVLHLSS